MLRDQSFTFAKLIPFSWNGNRLRLSCTDLDRWTTVSDEARRDQKLQIKRTNVVLSSCINQQMQTCEVHFVFYSLHLHILVTRDRLQGVLYQEYKKHNTNCTQYLLNSSKSLVHCFGRVSYYKNITKCFKTFIMIWYNRTHTQISGLKFWTILS